jgi:hypothetical protein
MDAEWDGLGIEGVRAHLSLAFGFTFVGCACSHWFGLVQNKSPDDVGNV